MPDVYPVIYTFREVVYGDGWIASVTTRGRAVMERHEDDWWSYGVLPGALAASGGTPLEADAAFRTAFVSVLFDLASEASSLEEFRKSAEEFFNQEDEIETERWVAAVAEFRSGKATPESPFSELPKLSADVDTFLLVERPEEVHSITAGANILPGATLRTAA